MNASAIATIGENIIIFASIFLFIRLGNMEKINDYYRELGIDVDKI